MFTYALTTELARRGMFDLNQPIDELLSDDVLEGLATTMVWQPGKRAFVIVLANTNIPHQSTRLIAEELFEQLARGDE